MTKPITRAEEKFFRRQIKLARKTAEYYRSFNDLDSAWTFEDCASNVEAELERRIAEREGVP